MESAENLPFIGRVPLITRASHLLRKAREKREPFNLLVHGERGVGKTRFVEEVARRAHDLGYKTIFCGCQKWDRQHPFTVICALVRVLLSRPPRWTPRNADTLAAAVTEKFPQLALDGQEMELLYWVLGGSGVGEKTLDLDELTRRGILTTVFGRFLENQLQHRMHLLVIVDDIHHSDEFSRDYLLTAPMPRGTAFILSVPSVDMLPIRIEASDFALKPFSEEEVAQALSLRYGGLAEAGQFAPELRRITRGSPLHLIQLLAEIPADAEVRDGLARLVGRSAPGGALEAACNRLDALDKFSLELVKAASVIADTFPMPVLRRMMGAKFPLQTALRGLRRAGLVKVEKYGSKETFHFRHGILREAASSLLNDIEREDLHAVAAEALKKYYGRQVENCLMSVAHHYEEAGDADRAASVYFRAGQRMFKLGDIRSAEEAFRAAYRLAHDEGKKLESMAELVKALNMSDKLEECLAMAKSFFGQEPPRILQPKVYVVLSQMHSASGSLPKAVESARKAIELGGQTGMREEVCRGYGQLAFALARMGKITEAMEAAKNSLAFAQQLKDASFLGGAFNILGAVRFFADDQAEAKRLFKRSAAVYQKAGHVYNTAQSKANAAAALSMMGDFEKGCKLFAEVVKLAEKLGAHGMATSARYNIAVNFAPMGEYTKSLAMMNEVLEYYERTKSAAEVGITLIVKAQTLVRMGRVEEALSDVEKGWGIVGKVGYERMKDTATETRVEAAIFRGETDRALEISGRFLDEVRATELKGMYLWSLLLRVRSLIAANRAAEAREIAALIEKELSTDSNPRNRAYSIAELARLAALEGDAGEAERLARTAISLGRLSREGRAELHMSIGEAALKAGESTRAEKYLELAHKEYSTLVKKGYRQRELQKVTELLEGGIAHGKG